MESEARMARTAEQELRELTDYFEEWHVAATTDTEAEIIGEPWYKVEFKGLTEEEARALIEAAKKVSGHEAKPPRK
jgi:hypothetical protein